MDMDAVANPAQGVHVMPGGARMTAAAAAGLACREYEATSTCRVPPFELQPRIVRFANVPVAADWLKQ